MGGGERRQGMREKMFSKTFLHTIVVANKILKNGMFSKIQQNILVKEQINITTPFYDEISKYSQSILANISSTKQ